MSGRGGDNEGRASRGVKRPRSRPRSSISLPTLVEGQVVTVPGRLWSSDWEGYDEQGVLVSVPKPGTQPSKACWLVYCPSMASANNECAVYRLNHRHAAALVPGSDNMFDALAVSMTGAPPEVQAQFFKQFGTVWYKFQGDWAKGDFVVAGWSQKAVVLTKLTGASRLPPKIRSPPLDGTIVLWSVKELREQLTHAPDGEDGTARLVGSKATPAAVKRALTTAFRMAGLLDREAGQGGHSSEDEVEEGGGAEASVGAVKRPHRKPRKSPAPKPLPRRRVWLDEVLLTAPASEIPPESTGVQYVWQLRRQVMQPPGSGGGATKKASVALAAIKAKAAAEQAAAPAPALTLAKPTTAPPAPAPQSATPATAPTAGGSEGVGPTGSALAAMAASFKDFATATSSPPTPAPSRVRWADQG